MQILHLSYEKIVSITKKDGLVCIFAQYQYSKMPVYFDSTGRLTSLDGFHYINAKIVVNVQKMHDKNILHLDNENGYNDLVARSKLLRWKTFFNSVYCESASYTCLK
jgi:hypothetical protein